MSAPLQDLGPELDDLRFEVLEGLRARPKTLPCKLFYDERGSQLFEQICELQEYYPTRTELAIMRRFGGEMARCIGARALLVEYGIGAGTKTRVLLDHLAAPAGYVPVDISREMLERTARALAKRHPALPVLPVCADYTQSFRLPRAPHPPSRRVVYYPGSTIGNFVPDEARAFLRRIASLCGRGGGLLIGVDLHKDRETLEAAYNDARGVTAAFNLNILARLNREMDAAFDLDRFEHRALFNESAGRIEMHLVSLCAQAVPISGEEVELQEGETICTEYSYKYGIEQFRALARSAGFACERSWTDPARHFSVHWLVAD